MPARGRHLCRNLLALGAYSSLRTGCGALDRGHVDGTFAMQVHQREGDGREDVRGRQLPRLGSPGGYYVQGVDISFVLTGFEDQGGLLGNSDAVYQMTQLLNASVCVAYDIYDCQFTLSASQSFSDGVLADIRVDRDTSEDAEALQAELDAAKSTVTAAISGPRVGMWNVAPFLAYRAVANALTGQLVVVGIQTYVVDSAVRGINDPHLTSVTGKKFDVNMPGSYVLIRVPHDQRLPAKLELNATVQATEGRPCGLYIKRVDLGGEWLGDQAVSVVPLQRNVEGENGAGNSTLRPFSVRIQEVQRGAARVGPGLYEKWGDLGKQGHTLSGRVRLVAVWRQVYADAGTPQEAQAFQFYVRGDGGEHGATLEAAQGAHQALDIRASGLRSLGFGRLGGLLGTEDHDRSLEELADACKDFRAKARQSSPTLPAGSSMSASWVAPI